jgi:hypothetical protein
MSTRRKLLWLAVASLLLVSCSGPGEGACAEDSPLASVLEGGARDESPLAGPGVLSPDTGQRLPLVVLHTNDNWGETEPCG